mmetsp:Transcript_11742/g.15952  ORF Transcript_11742/g.15952 Transcript_11742/m.15952 type:complete len:280 (-) Transcript_11742:94-933(-)
MAQRRILEAARPAMTELDRLILQMETTLGKPHSVSPFTPLLAQAAPAQAAPAEESKKGKGKAAKPEGEQKKAKKGKDAGAAQPKKGGKGGAAAAATDSSASLTEDLDTFSKCDIRVGRIVECAPHPESEKLYIEKIDLGEPEGKLRTIVSGLQPFVTLEEMLADKIMVFANMKPKKLAGIMSEGMVLCASNEEHTAVELMRPHADSVIGERVTLEGDFFGADGLAQEAQPILNPKRKVEPKLLEKLTTDKDRQGLFDGKKLVTKAGPILSKSLAEARIS